MENNSLLDVQHLSHMFHLKRKMTVKAIDDVSFQIKKGEIYGLVGESGSGKSTVARCIMNIYKPSEGEIFYKGIPICKSKEFRKNRKMLTICLYPPSCPIRTAPISPRSEVAQNRRNV